MDLLQTSRVATSEVLEVRLAARPDQGTEGFDAQARSLYARILEALAAEGLAAADILTETVFLRDVASQAPRLGAIRRELLAGPGGGAPPAALTRIQQPPATPRHLCEAQVLAARPASGGSFPGRALEGLPAGAAGRVITAGRLEHVFLAGVTGGDPGDGLDFHAQAASMFRVAEDALRRAGLSFRDVVRTWLFVADIDRDYAALNRARREFFRARGIDPPPASTGIQGVPFPPDRGCSLDLRAVAGAGPLKVAPFLTPTMNEAPSYGSDFSRGTRVDLGDRAVLYLSGTASIDDEGRVVRPGEIDGQLERTFVNLEGLLSGQGAGFEQAVSAVSYLKSAAYADAYRRAAARHGLPDRVPNTVCVADVCRPDWLCEIELTAVVLPG